MGGIDYTLKRKQLEWGCITNKVGPGSQRTYGSGWRLWKFFLRARDTHPYLMGSKAKEFKENEEALLDFIVHLFQYSQEPKARSRRS